MIAFAKPDNILAMPTPQGKSNEWYTPAKYIEAAREVMNGIDLDPASCALANQIIKATRYYSIEDDGLAQEWHGRIWLNPPYGDGRKYLKDKKTIGVMRAWVGKLIQHYEMGNIEQAILCCTLENGAKWFNWLWDYTICFPSHKVKFQADTASITWDGKYAHFHGTIFVYLGPNNEKFAEVFSEFGPVIPANVAVRRQQITPLSLWKVSND